MGYEHPYGSANIQGDGAVRLVLYSAIMGLGLACAAGSAGAEAIRITPPVKPMAPSGFPVGNPAPAAAPTAASDAGPAIPAVASAGAPPVKPAASVSSGAATVAALPAMPATAVSGPAKLVLNAVVIAGAQPVVEPMLWTVTVPSKVKGQPDEIVATQTAATPQFQLPPGHYRVSAQYGDAKISEELDVIAGDNRRTFDLKAGVIRMELIPYQGAKPVQDPITWEVYRYAQGDVNESLRLAAATAPQQRFILSDGHYIVRARYGSTVTDLVVPVPAGTNFKYTVNLYAGKAIMSALSHQTNKLYKKDVTWSVYRAKPDASGQRTLVATETAPEFTFQLREGHYIVVGQAGDLVGEMPFEVKAGKTEKVRVVLRQQAPGAAPAPTEPPASSG